VASETTLVQKLGQATYLTHLKSSGYGSDAKNSSNEEPCPICRAPLGRQWAVLACAHCYCLDCIRVMVRERSIGPKKDMVKCAICRQISKHAEMSYILGAPTREENADGDAVAEDGEDEPAVVGSYSTKIEGLVVALKKLKRKEPGARAIIFSSVSVSYFSIA
jgi:E3 ubiquitin-protein ligase SHPRH